MATPQEIVDEQVERKLDELTLVGRALRNNHVFDVDTMPVDKAEAEELDMITTTPQNYARDLVIETTCPDEGMRLLMSTGGPKVYAQHIIDLDEWYIAGLDGSARSIIELAPSDEDHSDALIALEFLKGDCAQDIRIVEG